MSSVYSGAKAAPLDEGRKIVVRGQEFVVPELVMGERERLEDEGVFEVTEEAADIAEKIRAAVGRDEVLKELRERQRKHMRKNMGAMAQVVHVALQRNYPELTLETIRREFSYSKLMEAYAAAIGVELARGSASPTAGEAIANSSGPTG